MKKALQKLKDWILIWIWIIFVLNLNSLVYATYTWINQPNVVSGNTLTANVWNEMVGNQNYLKQEIENIDTSNLVSKNGDTINGEINMNNNKITALAIPTATTDAANKAYVDWVSATGWQYQISCSDRNSNYRDSFCIRINTLDWTTECKYSRENYSLSDSNSRWIDCYWTPW